MFELILFICVSLMAVTITSLICLYFFRYIVYLIIDYAFRESDPDRDN